MKNTLAFIVFVLIVLAILFALSGKKYPSLPENEKHLRLISTEVCMKCHGSDGEYPLKKNHPPKFECFKCHKVKKTAI